MTQRSNPVELRKRVDVATALLAQGLSRATTVTQLAERYRVDRRTARRYVAAAAEELGAEIGAADMQSLLAETLERLNRLSHSCEASGNHSAAIAAARAAAHTLSAIYRADVLAASRLSGHTIATAEELTQPTNAQRRKYRRSIRDINNEMPF